MFSSCRRLNWRIICATLFITLNGGSFAFLSAQSVDGPQTPDDIEKQQSKVDRLIIQLGDAQYVNRVRAQAELKEMGLAAFDALHRARDHDDIEIAKRALYLVRSMQVHWAFPDDPAAVRKLLVGYGDRSNLVRKNLMEQLGKLENHQGVSALCRLVRYESSVPAFLLASATNRA